MRKLRELTVPRRDRSRTPDRRIWRGLAVTGSAVLASALVAGRFAPAPPNRDVRRFYRRLDKPSFTPPDPVFGVWGPLYTLTVLSGLRVWNGHGPARRQALGHWFGIQALNALWLWLGFGRRRLAAATAVAGANLLNTLAYVDTARRVDPAAAVMAVPLAAWLGFAALLTEELWRRNR